MVMFGKVRILLDSNSEVCCKLECMFLNSNKEYCLLEEYLS